jgi:hypothetical protein
MWYMLMSMPCPAVGVAFGGGRETYHIYEPQAVISLIEVSLEMVWEGEV